MVSWWIGNAVPLVACGVRNVRALRRAAVHLLATALRYARGCSPGCNSPPSGRVGVPVIARLRAGDAHVFPTAIT